MYRYDSAAHLQGWLDSPERAAWLQRAEPHVAGPMRTQVLTGLESWFTLATQPGVPPPPPYKMAIVTWATIFPLITLVVVATAPLLGSLPLVLRLAVTTGVTVPLMTWVVMPRMTRLLHRWLYPIPAGDHDPAGSLPRRSRMLGRYPIDVMLLATDLEVARTFYGEVLGLPLLLADEGFLTFGCGGDSRLVVTHSTTGTADQVTKASWRVDDLAGEVAWLPRRACAGWRPVRSPRAPAEAGWASGGDGAGGGSANHARQQNENAQQTSCQWRRIARSERYVLASFSQISSTRDRR